MKKLTPIIKMLSLKLLSCCSLAAIFLLATPYFSVAYEKEINNLSISMSEKIATSGKKTIAVVDFTDLQGNITELGRFLAEEFSAALVDAGKGFEVVDRIHLKSILKEHKLSASGLIDPTTARKLGKIAGVDALVTGTITPFGERVRVSVKVLATETAKVICASRGNIAKTKAIEELLAKGIETGIQVAAAPVKLKSTKKAFTGPSLIITDDSWKTFEFEFPNWKAVEFDDSCWSKPVISMTRSGLPGMEDSKAKWIWFPDRGANIPRFFRKVFYLKGKNFIGKARISVDDKAVVFVNGEKVCEAGYGKAVYCDISSYLRPGKNVVAVQAIDEGGGEGLMVELKIFPR